MSGQNNGLHSRCASPGEHRFAAPTLMRFFVVDLPEDLMMLELSNAEEIQLVPSSCACLNTISRRPLYWGEKPSNLFHLCCNNPIGRHNFQEISPYHISICTAKGTSLYGTVTISQRRKKEKKKKHIASVLPMTDSKFPALTAALRGLRNSAPQPSPTSTSSLPSLFKPSLKPRMSLPLTPPATPVKSPRRKHKNTPPQTPASSFVTTTTTTPPILNLHTIHPLRVPSKGLIPLPDAARSAALQFLIELHHQAHLSANLLGSGRPVSFVSPDKRLSPRSSGFRADCDVGGYRTALDRLRMGLEGFLEEGEFWWANNMLEDVEIALALLEGWTGREERVAEKGVKGKPEIDERYAEVLRLLFGSGSGETKY
ncbi:hypothetical protein HOY82DRAFT_628585 [Tuber indicum]|nr:hypothetical protein HOY82DRAFT_628585 [Tuber indicum]